MLRALLQRLTMAFALTAHVRIAGHPLRLVHALIVLVVEEILETMAAGIAEWFARSERDILQGGPGSGELARDRVGHMGGILANVLTRTAQVAGRLRGKRHGLEDQAEELRYR